MEPAGLGGLAGIDAGATDRAYVLVRGTDLHPGGASQDAAVEEGRAIDGKQPGLCRQLRQALAQLAGENVAPAQETSDAAEESNVPAPTPAAPSADMRILEIRRHFQRYRDLVSQGKLSDAGKELEAIQALVQQ